MLRTVGVAMGALLAAGVASHAEVAGSVRYSFREYQSPAQNRVLSARYDWLLRIDLVFVLTAWERNATRSTLNICIRTA
jgi:hypothetical protein